MKVCLDLHDWSLAQNRLELLFKLKETFLDFKVSLFTIPIDSKSDYGSFLIRDEILAKVKENLDWIQIIPHGLNHNGPEMKNCSYDNFRRDIMPVIKNAFERDGLPYVEGFCAPHWRWNDGVVKALDEAGWWGAIDRRQPNMPATKRFYRYSHCIDELLDGKEVMKLHGHIYGTSNDLGKCFGNIIGLPRSVEWHFVTDFIETG
ncbi:MAG: hypothetical protein PH343_08800 [Nitrospira sp.]|jgi:hypothetical protein|nr:hypothetical protein [Nitrospira sp.]